MGENQVQVLVAGAPGLVAALEASGRFAKVFGCATTSALKDLIPVLLQSGVTQQQLVFVFCDGLIADTPGVSMEALIDKLTSRGWSVALLETGPNARVIVQAHPGAGLIPAPVSTNNVLGALSGMGVGLITPVAEAWGFKPLDVADADAFAWMSTPSVAPIMQDSSPWGSAPASPVPTPTPDASVANAAATAAPAAGSEPWNAAPGPVDAPVPVPALALPTASPAPWEAAAAVVDAAQPAPAPAPWETQSAPIQPVVASSLVSAPWESQGVQVAAVEQPAVQAPWETASVPGATQPISAPASAGDPWATQSTPTPTDAAAPWETAQAPAQEPWGVQAPAAQPSAGESWETAQAPAEAHAPAGDPWASAAPATELPATSMPDAAMPAAGAWESAAAPAATQAPASPVAPWEAAAAPQAQTAAPVDPWTTQAAAAAVAPASAAQPWGVAPGPDAQAPAAQAPAAWETAAQTPADPWTTQSAPADTPWGAAAPPAAPAVPSSSNPWETAQAPAPIGGHTAQGAYPTQPQSNRRGLAVAVTVAKGGVGKSSLTLNLGAYLGLRLRELGRTVCIVDANFQQADIGKQINAYTPNIATLVRSMEDLTPERIGRHLLHRPDLNVSFLLGPSSPEEANPVWITPDLYGQCLEVLRRLYDYIIIDCPVAEFHHELFERFVLPSVDFLMVPVEPDIPTIMNTDNWLRAITAPQHAGGNGVDERRIGIVLNKAEEGIGVSQEDVMVNLSNWAFLGTVPMSKEWRRARNQDEIVATRNYAELNTAFAKILYAITGEQDLLSGHGEVPTKKKFGRKSKKK